MKIEMKDIRELGTTVLINTGAVAFVKMVELKDIMTILVLTATFIYTCIKIGMLFRKKKKLKNGD